MYSWGLMGVLTLFFYSFVGTVVEAEVCGRVGCMGEGCMGE